MEKEENVNEKTALHSSIMCKAFTQRKPSSDKRFINIAALKSTLQEALASMTYDPFRAMCGREKHLWNESQAYSPFFAPICCLYHQTTDPPQYSSRKGSISKPFLLSLCLFITEM